MGSGLDTGLWPMAGNMGQGAGRGFPDEAFGQRLSSTGADPGPSGERSVAGVGGVLGGPPWQVHRHPQSCGKGQTQASAVLWQRTDTGLQDKFQGRCQGSLSIGSGRGGSEG